MKSEGLEFEDFRAPRGDGESLVSPPLESATKLLATNKLRSKRLPIELSQLRNAARSHLIEAAIAHTSPYRDFKRPASADTIVLGGHQPTLYHPGVWFKNYALHHVAESTGATAINLIVDTDISSPPAIRVPTLMGDQIRLATAAYDRRAGGLPFEETAVHDGEWFARFDARLVKSLSGLVHEPLVRSLWDEIRAAMRQNRNEGRLFAQARHVLESEIGLQTLEVAQSELCNHQSFAAFALRILGDLRRFHSCYNDSADAYRLAHGIRSKAHPVPNLKRAGDWYETPFWIYGRKSPNRKAAWVRHVGKGRLEISDRESRNATISHFESDSAASELAALQTPDFKFRSRAIVTTMFARLVLSDLFLHGIGGGKYDQLCDLIAARFWRIQPPAFMVISATLHLPGASDYSTASITDQIHRLKRMLRDTLYQPERFTQVSAMHVEHKQQLIADVPERGHRGAWHQAICAVNDLMTGELQDIRLDLKSRLKELEGKVRESRIWTSREHPYCIFPIEQLTNAFEQMLTPTKRR